MLDWTSAHVADPQTSIPTDLEVLEPVLLGQTVDDIDVDCAADVGLPSTVSSELDAIWRAVTSPSSDVNARNGVSNESVDPSVAGTAAPRRRRAPPSAAKARLRSYERRSRSKREVSGRYRYRPITARKGSTLQASK